MLQTDDPEHRYTLLELIGSGSFGRVYKAMDKETGGIVAIKLIPICEEGNEDELKKIIREINLLQQCDSSYVTAYYGSYFKDKRLWIVMEYCSGGSLKRVMTRLKSPLTEEEISVVCYQVAKGLAHLHSRRLLHRDIKAGNPHVFISCHPTSHSFAIFPASKTTFCSIQTALPSSRTWVWLQ